MADVSVLTRTFRSESIDLNLRCRAKRTSRIRDLHSKRTRAYLPYKSGAFVCKIQEAN